MFELETCFPTLTHFAVAVAVLAIAEVVYVMLGFGAGLIAVGALATLFPNIRDVVVMLLLLNLPAETYIVVRERRTIHLPELTRTLLGIAVGIPLGAWVLKTYEPTILLPILGGLLLAFGLFFFVTIGKLGTVKEASIPKWCEVPIGLSAGLLAAMFGTGGPPLILLYQFRGVPKSLFRANLMACFFFFSLLRIPSYGLSGLLTSERITSSLLVLPAVLLGAVVGNRIHVKMSEKRFKQIVSLAIAAIGVALLIR